MRNKSFFPKEIFTNEIHSFSCRVAYTDIVKAISVVRLENAVSAVVEQVQAVSFETRILLHVPHDLLLFLLDRKIFRLWHKRDHLQRMISFEDMEKSFCRRESCQQNKRNERRWHLSHMREPIPDKTSDCCSDVVLGLAPMAMVKRKNVFNEYEYSFLLIFDFSHSWFYPGSLGSP